MAPRRSAGKMKGNLTDEQKSYIEEKVFLRDESSHTMGRLINDERIWLKKPTHHLKPVPPAKPTARRRCIRRIALARKRPILRQSSAKQVGPHAFLHNPEAETRREHGIHPVQNCTFLVRRRTVAAIGLNALTAVILTCAAVPALANIGVRVFHQDSIQCGWIRRRSGDGTKKIRGPPLDAELLSVGSASAGW